MLSSVLCVLHFLSISRSITRCLTFSGCGHCKKAKPEYMTAAKRLKDDGIDAVLAAVDATVHK